MRPTSPRPSLPETLETVADASGTSFAGPGCAGFHTKRDSRNQRRFIVWMLAAALAYVGATAALRWRESIPKALPWLLVGLALLLAIQATRSYLVFLREADELLRRIQTEALALGFGSGAVLSLLYPMLEGLGAPQLDGHATAVVMMLSWSAGSWLGTRRYSGSGAA
ncbi:MAG TPA: hypothetical protein VHR45_24360 [Thermoanaerobaculia bacterium]|nr:hypothetical protein [Thermoanaerobaculia bacterium]